MDSCVIYSFSFVASYTVVIFSAAQMVSGKLDWVYENLLVWRHGSWWEVIPLGNQAVGLF
jgi:hypothetical protein